MKKLFSLILILLLTAGLVAQVKISGGAKIGGTVKAGVSGGGFAAFDKGFNFRDTSAYVTDPADTTYVENPTTEGDYPHTRNGVTFGWINSAGAIEARDRSTGVNARVAGMHFVVAPTQKLFQVDLPAAGVYDIHLALGDQAGGQTVYAQILDNTSVLTTIGETATGGGNRYVDATNTVRTSDTDWVSNNVAYQGTFATTTFNLRVGFSSGTNASCVAHLRIVRVS